MANFIARRDHVSTRHAHVHVLGRFAGNAASDPTVFDKKGQISSVSRDSQGVYTVTLKHTWPSIVFPGIAILGTPRLVGLMLSEDINGLGTFTFEVLDLATPTLTDLTSSELCYFDIEVVNSASA